LLGSLRQQIAYPSIYPGEEIDGDVDLIFDGRSRKNSISISPTESDEELLEILRKVKLDNLAMRTGAGDERVGLGEHRDWSKVHLCTEIRVYASHISLSYFSKALTPVEKFVKFFQFSVQIPPGTSNYSEFER
jgi:hypothetical protein